MASPVQRLKPLLLLTRPLADAQRTLADFEALGYEVLCSPVVEIYPLMVQISPHDILCISSKNALHTLKEIPKTTPIFCVGSQTLQSLQERGFNTITQAPTAKDLLSLLPTEGRILYLSGDVFTLNFAEALENCERLQCYTTKPLEDLTLQARQAFETMAFIHAPVYSERSGELLHKLLCKNKVSLEGIKTIALSQKVAATLRDLGFTTILTARTSTHRGILEILQETTHD